jgi:hypothetical protein
MAQMEKLLESRNYSGVLQAYASLPPDKASSPWPLICRMRALVAMKDLDGLGRFFSEHSLDDGEYHAMRSRYLAYRGLWREAIAAAEAATSTAIRYAPAIRVRREAAYNMALSKSGIYQGSGDDASRNDALDAWFQVKYAYRNEQNHSRYNEANSRIRELSGTE